MTDTRSTFVAHDASDLLDLLPALFGFTPQQSFIAIATEGERRRFGFRLRLDVPPLEKVDLAAKQVANYLRRQGPDGAVLIAVTDRAAVADAMMAAVVAELVDIPVHEAVRTDGDQYWIYGDDGPGDGMPYVGRCSPAVVGAVFQGMQILPDREALVARFAEVTGLRKAGMIQTTEEVFGKVMWELTETPETKLGVVGMSRLRPILQRHAAGTQLTDIERATLAVWVSSVSVRDEVWTMMNRANAESTLALWTDVAQSVVEPFEPPVLCLAAFAAWLSGDGVQALIAVERALEIQPTYSMAQLILGLLDSAMPPDRWTGFHTARPLTS